VFKQSAVNIISFSANLEVFLWHFNMIKNFSLIFFVRNSTPPKLDLPNSSISQLEFQSKVSFKNSNSSGLSQYLFC